MSVIFSLGPRLALSRIRGVKAGGWLDVAAIGAFTVSTWMFMTVAAGTSMFYNRMLNPPAVLLSAPGLNGTKVSGVDSIAGTYVILAGLACVLLFSPIISLGMGAARLGARGRNRRLAALRLIGMTSAEVIFISLTEICVQALLGAALGLVIFVVSLPLWAKVSFQLTPISWGEMIPDWWVWLAVVGIILVLAFVSAVIGLSRVRISPLGVTADHSVGRLGPWRPFLLVTSLIIFMIAAQLLGKFDLIVVVAVGLVLLLIVIGMVSLTGPWMIQLIALLGTTSANPARILAARRILADPRGTWRNVSGLALLGTVSSFVGVTSSLATSPSINPNYDFFSSDILLGVAITLVIAMLVAGMQTAVQMASEVIDQADISRALYRSGAGLEVLNRARREQVLLPLLVTITVSTLVGLVLALPAAGQHFLNPFGLVLIGLNFVLGVTIVVGMSELCRPLLHLVVNDHVRRGD